ncbi:MAG: hypothetical protein ACXW5U_20870 [Thermoanaerobaculia bacterium]
MRRLALLALALVLACSRETPAPPHTPTPSTAAPTAEITTSSTTRVPELQKGTYDEALLWFRSTRAFHFVLDDQGVHAEGDVARTTPGAEKVQFRANGTEWLAETTAQGVTWKRRDGSAWKSVDAPEFGPRIYQRVTLPFDPQKKEGVPLLASEEGQTNLYRFTNANTGEVHEIWVRKSDAAVERLKIGEKVDLKIAVR